MKKGSTPGKPVIPSSGHQAFAAIQHEIEALPDEQLKSISVDIAYAHAIALVAADRIDMLIPELSRLPFFDMRPVLMIRTYAAACQHAHLLAKAPDPVDATLSALLEEATTLREDMLASAELLARFGFASAERVAAIRSGNGHVDTANDVDQLGVLFSEIWAEVAGRTPLTRAMVDRAPVLAHQLHGALGARRLDRRRYRDDRQRTRVRAFTLFARAYEQCRRGVSFLRHDEGDAEEFAPSIYIKQRRAAASASPPSDPEPTPLTTPPHAGSNDV